MFDQQQQRHNCMLCPGSATTTEDEAMPRTPRGRPLRHSKIAAIKKSADFVTLEDRYDEDGVPRNEEDDDSNDAGDFDDESCIESVDGGGEGSWSDVNTTCNTVSNSSSGHQADDPSESSEEAAVIAECDDTVEEIASDVGLEVSSSDDDFETGVGINQVYGEQEEDEPHTPTILEHLGSELVACDDDTLEEKLKVAAYEELELQAAVSDATRRLEVKRALIRGIKMVLDDRRQQLQSARQDSNNTGEDLTHSQPAAESDGGEEGVTWEEPDPDVDFSFEHEEERQVDQETPVSEVPMRIKNIATSTVSNEALRSYYPNRGRHLCINPCNPSAIATSGLAGGLEIWQYSHEPRTLSRVALLDPLSFRSKMQKAAAIAWSPEGTDIAIGFEYPCDDKIEFCVAQLSGFKPLEDAKTPQIVPTDRVSLVTSRTHGLGLSSIAWVPSSAGQDARKLVTTGRAEGDTVALWSEGERSDESQSHWHEHVLHSGQHQDSVQAMCVHAGQSMVFTGGRDGHVVRCSLQSGHADTVMAAGSDDDALNVNAVLEHPTDSNMLMVGSVEVGQNRVVLHDLRQRYTGVRSAASVLVWSSDAFATRRLHMEPRWSPTGVHVSCGGTGGVVSIWDVRVTASTNVEPCQFLHLHCGTLPPWVGEVCFEFLKCVILFVRSGRRSSRDLAPDVPGAILRFERASHRREHLWLAW